jgi:outer membrane biogenesis lipoprotein LolB
VTPEMLERVHGNIVKRTNKCLLLLLLLLLTANRLDAQKENDTQNTITTQQPQDANGQNFEHLF